MSLYSELKDRKVIRVAAVYLVVAWLIMQVVAVVSAPLLLPDWFARVVILLLTLGFPIALILSWAFDATPAEAVGSSGNSNTISGKPLALGLIALTAVAVIFVLTGFNSGESEPQEIALVESPEPIAPLVEILEEQGVLPNSVAVLLCDNLSPDPNDAYFAAGIHEEILNQLVKLSALNVIARTSVLQYADSPPPIPQIAYELNVGSVMECSVRFAGTSIMVTAQLIDPVTNSHLWSETYPGDIGDLSGVFAMQADIAMNIANALHAEFSLEEQAAIEAIPTSSPEAYRLYLEAQTIRQSNGGNILAKVPLFLDLLERAVAFDPDFALAYASKAQAIANLLGFGVPLPEGSLAVATEAAERALILDPNLSSAFAAAGQIHQYKFEGVEAEKDLNTAYRLSPNDTQVLLWYAQFKRSRSEYAEAVRLLERAVRLNPKVANYWHQLGLTYVTAGDPDAAIAAYDKALEIAPYAGIFLMESASAYYHAGQPDRAEQALRLSEAAGGVGIGFLQSIMALAYERLGRPEDAERVFSQLQQEVSAGSPDSLVFVWGYVAVGEYDLAYNLVLRAINSEFPVPTAFAAELKQNRWMHPVFDEPRFVELIDQMGYQD